jgi:hypothetical protein
LAGGLSIERAAELIAALCSVDLYRSLVVEAGWTSQEYEAQLTRLVASTLGLSAADVHRTSERSRRVGTIRGPQTT